MQLKQNKKGMTLIEIVVVLLISTIIMSIVGSMILSSMGYFSEEVVSQQDKEGLIDISSYIRKELSYATDVRVAIETEERERELERDGWHWLSIKDGKLYKDDGQLLSDNYYQNRKITIKVHGFDNYRLDINLKYLDNANKAVASNKTSLELMNLKADKDVVREYAPFSTAMDINETQKIYYIIKEKVVEPEPPAIDGEGTVEDQLDCIKYYNNRETYIAGSTYRVGDYVQTDDGTWWMIVRESTGNADNEIPGHENTPIWKKISSEFATNSAYEVGDIVIYNAEYYEANSLMKDAPAPVPGTDINKWKYLGKNKPETTNTCKGRIHEQKLATVRKEIPVGEIAEFDKDIEKSYEIDDIVKVTDKSTGMVKYYIKIKKNGSAPGDGTGSGWKRLARDLDVNSSYLAGDIVLYYKDNIVAVRFTKNIDHPNIDIVGDITSTQGHKYVELIKKGDESYYEEHTNR